MFPFTDPDIYARRLAPLAEEDGAMASPIYDDEYNGPRWRYGLNYRPANYGAVPNGYIVFSDRPDQRFNFGTLDYPTQLREEEVRGYELTFVGMIPSTSPV